MGSPLGRQLRVRQGAIDERRWCPRDPAGLVVPNELVERRLLIDVLSVSSGFDRDVMKKQLQKNIEIPEEKE
jgi:hypothetical protein